MRLGRVSSPVAGRLIDAERDDQEAQAMRICASLTAEPIEVGLRYVAPVRAAL
jgi:hypothetical protein